MLLETLRCEGGTPLFLSYHQQRLDEACRSLGMAQTYNLQELIIPPGNGLYRCRFLYSEQHHRIEFHPLSPRVIASLKLVHADYLHYPHKFSDRRELDRLFEQRGECDEVLIVRNGFLTDTTIANVALMIGGRWVTPDQPLLGGTTRARLIDEGFLHPEPLSLDDIAKASRIAVMNAIMGFVEVENGIII